MPRRNRSVDVLVRKVRAKLEAAPDWRYVHTHFGIGYRFMPKAWSAQQKQRISLSDRYTEGAVMSSSHYMAIGSAQRVPPSFQAHLRRLRVGIARVR